MLAEINKGSADKAKNVDGFVKVNKCFAKQVFLKKKRERYINDKSPYFVDLNWLISILFRLILSKKNLSQGFVRALATVYTRQKDVESQKEKIFKDIQCDIEV